MNYKNFKHLKTKIYLILKLAIEIQTVVLWKKEEEMRKTEMCLTKERPVMEALLLKKEVVQFPKICRVKRHILEKVVVQFPQI